MRLQPRLIITICGVVSGLALAGCSSGSDGAPEAVSATAVGSDTASVPGGSDAGGTGGGATGYGDLCEAKQQTGDALLDAAGTRPMRSTRATSRPSVRRMSPTTTPTRPTWTRWSNSPVRSATTPPSRRRSWPAPRKRSKRAGNCSTRPSPERGSGLESADSVEEIVEVFNEFNNDLRGTPPDFKPQLLPPVIVSWGMEPNTACNNS